MKEIKESPMKEIKKMLWKSLSFKFLIESNLLNFSLGWNFARISFQVSSIHLLNKPFSVNYSILNSMKEEINNYFGFTIFYKTFLILFKRSLKFRKF
jgi:hypothetical protein